MTACSSPGGRVPRWPPATVNSYGDHRIAMAAAVARAVSQRPGPYSGWDASATSYPSFEEDLRQWLR